MIEGTEPPRGSRHHIPWVYLSTLSFFLAGAIFYLYLARVLPTTELGSVVVLLAIGTLVSACFSLGLGPGFQHYLSYYIGRRDPGTVRSLVRSALVSTAVLSVATAATTVVLSGELSALFFHSVSDASLIEILGLYAGLLTGLTLLQSILLGIQRFIIYSGISTLAYAASYGTPIVFLTLWPDLRSVILGWTVGAALGCGLFLVSVLSRATGGPAPDGAAAAPRGASLYRAVLAYSLPLFAATVITSGAVYVDRLVLASLSDLASVGVYNYAILVGSGSLIITNPFSTILVPKLSERFGSGERDAIRGMVTTSITLVVLLYVPFALALAAIGPALLALLVGGAFVAASTPMAILLGLTAVAVPATILTSLAAGVRRPGALVRASAFAVVANAGISFVLVPRIGMDGAAIGNSAMIWGAFLVLWLSLRDTGFVQIDLRSVGRIWASAAVMAGAIALPLYLFGYPLALLPVALAAGLGVLLVMLRLTRAVPAEVVAFFEGLLPRWLRFVRPAIEWVAPGPRPAASAVVPVGTGTAEEPAGAGTGDLAEGATEPPPLPSRPMDPGRATSLGPTRAPVSAEVGTQEGFRQ